MITSVESYFDTHQIYDAVVYEIFNNNFGEEEEANSDEEAKGASGLLRGLESNWRKNKWPNKILSLKIVTAFPSS